MMQRSSLAAIVGDEIRQHEDRLGMEHEDAVGQITRMYRLEFKKKRFLLKKIKLWENLFEMLKTVNSDVYEELKKHAPPIEHIRVDKPNPVNKLTRPNTIHAFNNIGNKNNSTISPSVTTTKMLKRSASTMIGDTKQSANGGGGWSNKKKTVTDSNSENKIEKIHFDDKNYAIFDGKEYLLRNKPENIDPSYTLGRSSKDANVSNGGGSSNSSSKVIENEKKNNSVIKASTDNKTSGNSSNGLHRTDTVTKNNIPVYSNKYVEPVRSKALRESLPGHSCIQCAEFYQALKDQGFDDVELLNNCSRHKSTWKLPETPEGFWSLGSL